MIARLTHVVVLLALVVAGCNGCWVGPPPAKKPAPVATTQSALTHVVHADSAYYTTGPQQSRPPDGTFKAGTKVKLLRDAGSYSQVESEGGVTAFVSTGSLAPAKK